MPVQSGCRICTVVLYNLYVVFIDNSAFASKCITKINVVCTDLGDFSMLYIFFSSLFVYTTLSAASRLNSLCIIRCVVCM